jgi:hypothetical protein
MMRRSLIFWAIILLVQSISISAFAQQDQLVGRWEGKVQSPQGERPTTVIFKKEAAGYIGRTSGMRPGTEIQLKDIKFEGNQFTARADVETPQATITINYTFTLEGEAMKGQGALDFGGQSMTFDISLKRVSNDTEGPLTSASQAQAGGQQRQRVDVPQPQQKQSIDYFVGQWGFKYVGRESALWPAPREGVLTFTKLPDGKSVEGVIVGKHDSGAYRETNAMSFDETTKMLTFTEKLSSGAVLNSKGDWTSPISIRFTIDPVKMKGQSLQLRRIISIIAGHSFTVAEELSEDGGPFVRLGSAVFTKAGAK